MKPKGGHYDPKKLGGGYHKILSAFYALSIHNWKHHNCILPETVSISVQSANKRAQVSHNMKENSTYICKA